MNGDGKTADRDLSSVDGAESAQVCRMFSVSYDMSPDKAYQSTHAYKKTLVTWNFTVMCDNVNPIFHLEQPVL